MAKKDQKTGRSSYQARQMRLFRIVFVVVSVLLLLSMVLSLFINV